MFENVLVGVDGKQGGRDAIALASLLAAPDERLSLAHVEPGERHPSRAANLSFGAAQREDSRGLLEGERAATATKAEIHTISSESVGGGLHRLAESQGADLLVVGSCARGLLGRVLVGDDTAASMNGAPCAVAIAPSGFAARSPGISAVGVGYDGSSQSEVALQLARTLAAEHQASLSALTVVRLPSSVYTQLGPIGMVQPAPFYPNENAEELIAAAERRLEQLGDLSGHVVSGLPAEELTRFSGEVDLLVLGSRGYGPLRRLMLGGTARQLARGARCALLLPALPDVASPLDAVFHRGAEVQTTVSN
jgi:nucleotide-binding universal stress UspA family protein